MRLVRPPKTHLYWVPLTFNAGHFVQELLLSGAVSANTHSSRSSSSTSTSSLSIRSFHCLIILMQSKALMNPKFEPCIFQPVKFECLRCKGDRYRSDSIKVCIIFWQKQESRFFWKGNKYISFIAVKHYSLFRVRGTFCMFYRGQCRMEPRK